MLLHVHECCYMNVERAIELCYKFKYRKCVYFNSEIIFDEYVKFYYNLKKNSYPYSSSYMTSKIFLNSLYGRLGMKPNLDKYIISNRDN